MRGGGGAPPEHDPLTCELCHAEGVGAELVALRAENERLRDVDAAAERIFASGILDEIYEHAYEFGQRGRPVGSDRDCMQDAVSIARLALASTTEEASD